MTRKQVLTIAGSDSGGGAGIQADLKTFQERRVFGTSVITAVTAQNTLGVHGVHPIPHDMVQQQIEAIFSDFEIAAMKTGMLVDGSYMKLIAEELKKHPKIPLVIDPVMIAKGGAALMENDAVDVMKASLLPLVDVLTPNIPETEALTSLTIKTHEDMIKAAYALQNMGSRNIVVKGGHFEDETEAADLLLTEKGEEIWLTSPRIDTKDTHGTGCTFSACITAELAKGHSVKESVQVAKEYIQAAISYPLTIGQGHGPTNHWAYREAE